MSSSQSVSVVPITQCRPHGMMNSTDFSVRRISPVSGDPVARHDDVHALAGPDPELPALAQPAPAVSSVHTPVALMTCRAADVDLAPGLQVAHPAPVTRSPSLQQADHLRAEATCAP